ncbi:hypothetical protein F5876DRAFT_68440 [Lentinula aff. lateritia]|uniref:Uncharacterized protein n=1 Tax=Lentinula aff. lateritia TaxID=2804960 RepID=A0ACC1TQL0_9AGAR|nr:hypothetical protein F5876DRAFT_68440 [Lentinula aff. lateritia]
MSIPFTIGKLIDFFSSVNPQIPLGLSIVAQLREQTCSASLHQEVGFVECGEGDVFSRLSVDTTFVGESESHVLPISNFDNPHVMCRSPVSFGVVFHGHYLKRLSNRTQAMGEMSKHATETLSALRTVQAYNNQPQEEQELHEKVINV